MTYNGPEWAVDLANQLEKWKSNTGVMADLRRGRGKSPVDCMPLHRWVSRFVSDNQVGSGREWAVYTVASQFALHPDLPSCDRFLGWSLEQLASHGSSSRPQIEARLVRLTQSRTSADLCRRLPGVLSIIAGHKEPLSWSLLAADIDGWDTDSPRVARRWLRDFSNESTNDNGEPGAPVREQGAN